MPCRPDIPRPPGLLQNRGLVLLAVISIFAFSIPLEASDSGVRVEVYSGPAMEVEPHQIVSAIFRVVNVTDTGYEFTPTIETPAGWTIVSSLFPFILKPGEEQFLFAAVSIPADTLAGKYVISASVIATAYAGITDSESIEINVLPVAKMEVKPPVGEYRTFPDETYTRVFTVVNLSNAPSRFVAEVSSYPEWPVTFAPAEFSLGPGESVAVSVDVRVPGDIRAETTHEVTLSVHALDLNHGSINAKAKSEATIYPNLLAGDKYENLSGTSTILFSWQEEGDFTSQLKVDLEGDLGEGQYGELRYVVPYFSDWRGQRFLEEDTFYAKYGDDKWGYLSLGDSTLNITPLTERYFYGRGVDFEYDSEDWGFRGFASKKKSGWLQGAIAGGQIKHTSGDTELTLTGIFKEEGSPSFLTNEADEHSGSVTLLCSTKPTEEILLDGEVGWGKIDGGDDSGSDLAYRAAADFDTDEFDLSGEVIHAGDNFPGYWRGSDVANIYAGYNPSPDFNLWASFTKNKWSFLGNDEFPKPLTENLNAGVHFLAGDLGRASVYYQWSNRKDVNLFSWDENDQSLNFELSKHFNNLSLSWYSSFGVREDNLTGVDSDLKKHQLTLTTYLDEGSVFSAGYRWNADDVFSGGTTNRSDQYWLNGDFKLSDQTQVTARYTHNSGNTLSRNAWLRAEITQLIGDGKSVQVIAQQHRGENIDDLAIAMKLVLPLDIPIPWLPKSGSLIGKVFLTETGESLADVVIRGDGMVVATNPDGKFEFPSLEEGIYAVRVERGTLGAGLIPDIILPVEILITPGKTEELDIPITKGASITGKVVVVDDGVEQAENGLSRAVLILKGDDETLNIVANSDGHFEFGDIRPGIWVLHLADGQLGEYSEVSPLEIELDLDPGESVDYLEFRITPTERPMEITVNG